MKLALIQMETHYGRKAENLEGAVRAIEQASKEHPDFYITVVGLVPEPDRRLGQGRPSPTH
ncbi:MAG: hypothetical protein AMS15_05625 [Planctomycetes bacterium DG_23]|nr:MAG: hypothetical protein AMS15_05625 [Planctomycetes bacterium DG_23]